MLKDRQKTLSDMKANATSRTDHDITDDDGGAIEARRALCARAKSRRYEWDLHSARKLAF